MERKKCKPSGSLVAIDVATGEVLAMVSAPSYNPNNRQDFSASRSRNRAATDMFEPGSTMKPFSAIAALESGQYTMDSVIDTLKGKLAVDDYVIQDHGKNYGRISLADVITKSSNIGIARVALSLPEGSLFALLQRLGFGVSTFQDFQAKWRGD